MSKEIMVSINCTTYNQESYIADAIESFLMQKTNFKYEILIHDDASTDGTTQIIKEYEKKYPNIIKPIYQVENQYSKGIDVFQYNMKRAKGKYIALCEGDDYWTDEYKLQKQVDYMESNPDCTLCVHSVEKVRARDGRKKGEIRPYRSSRKCYVEDFIIGGGDFIGTNSILFPKDSFKNPPNSYLDCSVGDYPLQIILASKGYAYYFDENMSSYRVCAKNSWSQRMQKGNKEENSIKNAKKMDIMLDQFNIETDKVYEKAVLERKRIHEFHIAILKWDYKGIKQEKFSDLYDNLSKKSKFKLLLQYISPRFFNLIISLKDKFRYE